jgi:molybdopterin-guanine dinucleotide biosynthesis protein A
LLVPGFVHRLAECLGDFEIVAAKVDGFAHPLPAVYRVSIGQSVNRLLQADQLRLGQLLEQSRTCFLSAADFHDVDPELYSLRNINHPDDYAAALAASGF